MPVSLLDIAPDELTPEEQAKGLTLESPAVRNRIVTQLWDRRSRSRGRPALFTAGAPSRSRSAISTTTSKH